MRGMTTLILAVCLAASGGLREPAPGGAKGAPMLGATVGAYGDVYVRTQDGWRFKSRSVFTPQELAAPNK